MSTIPLAELEELLAAVLERPPEEREQSLGQVCEGNSELRQELEELLSLHDDAADYFHDLSGSIAAAAPLELESAARPRIEIGPYKTLEAIGQGGMGAVYRAQRIDGEFDQEVALKLIHRDMDTPQLRARFLAERQLLARLSHPHIAHLLDGGVTDEGRPYFVMELLEGSPISHYCREEKLPLEDVLRLFLDVIDAVSYLHRNLVVHRDLKPSNILVDRDGQAKLLDFGIAKLVAEDPEGGEKTHTGALLMTPEYGAPEQAEGAAVTTATDVYSLGVVLFELLTGQRPPKDGAPSSLYHLPPTPSSLLRARHKDTEAGAKTAANGPPDLPAQPPWSQIPRDLDDICLKALRPEPEARYPSAEQLGQDLERYLEGLPVRASKGTLGYRLGKFLKRQRRGVAAVTAVLALAAFGFYRERALRSLAEEARSDAQIETAKAVAVSDFLAELLSSVDPRKAQGNEVTVADVLDQAAARIEESPELRQQPEVEATLRSTIAETYQSLGRFTDAREHRERAVELRGGMEARNPEALAAISDLGVLYGVLGLYAEAESIHGSVLAARTETLGEDHPDTLTALSRMADFLWSQARYDEVEPVDRRTLEIRRRLLGHDHLDTLKSENALGATLFTTGRYAEAATIFAHVLESYRGQLGDTHPDTIQVMSNLAAAYTELGRYAESESINRELLATRIRVFGAEHHETAQSFHNLGTTLNQMARYEEAEECLRRAMELREKSPGNRSSYLFSASYLGDVLREQGRWDEAEELYLSTLEQQTESLGPEFGDTLRTKTALADLRRRQGRLNDAEALIHEILDLQTEVRGEGHPDTLGSMTILAGIRRDQGRLEESLAVTQKSLDLASESLGPTNPVTLEAILEKARTLASMGRRQEARQLATKVFESRVEVLGKEHPSTVEAQSFLDSTL